MSDEISYGDFFGDAHAPSEGDKRTASVKEPVTWGDWLADTGKSVGSGLVKGVVALPGIAGDVEQLSRSALKTVGADVDTDHTFAPTTHDFQKIASDYVPFARETIEYAPQTTAGKYAQTISEFAPAVLAGPVKSAVTAGRALPTVAREIAAPTMQKVVGAAVVPAVASEAAGQATEGTWLEPYARVAGAVAGHGAHGVVSALTGTREGARNAVRNATPGITARDLDAMDELMNAAREQGVALTRAEALQQVTGGRTSLPDLLRVAEGRGAMVPFFAQRPQQVEGATNAMLDTIAERQIAPEKLGPDISKAARAEMRDAERAVTRESAPHYEKANPVKVDRSAIDESLSLIDDMKARDKTGLTHPELDRLRTQLANSDDIENLDRIRKNLRDRLTYVPGTADALDKETYATLRKAIAPVTKAMTEASPEYVKAREAYRRAQHEIVEPLKASPLGRLARKDRATQDVFNALFPKNPLAQSDSAIFDTVSRLSSRNPNAARGLVRAYLDTEFSAARKNILSSEKRDGAKFANAIAGNAQQERNLYAAIDALQGAGTSDGVRRLLDVLRATGQRQAIGSKTAFNAETLEQLGRGNVMTEAMMTLGTGIPRTLRDRFTRWATGANTDELSKLLTDPRAASKFRELALAEPDSPGWRDAMKGLLTLSQRGARIVPQTSAHTVGAVTFLDDAARDRTEEMRDGRATGGAVTRARRLDAAANRAKRDISLETTPLMETPDEQIAQALRIASRV